MDLGRTFHRHFSSKNRADSGSTLHAVESKASSNFENVTTENEINIKTIEQKEDTISTSGSIIENQTTAVKSSQIPVWRKGIHRRVGVAFSALGFVISSSRALWTDKQSAWKPTAEALRNFLQTSGIDLELSPLLNVRLLDNVILLNRIEWAALRGQDRRDLALQSSPTLLPIPSHEEALR